MTKLEEFIERVPVFPSFSGPETRRPEELSDGRRKRTPEAVDLFLQSSILSSILHEFYFPTGCTYNEIRKINFPSLLTSL
jgi:hypothetical protein